MLKVLIMLSLLAGHAEAKGSRVHKQPPRYYLNGAEVPVEKALMASLKGEVVMKCQTMETHVSKSGTSVSMKAVKP